MNKRVLVTTTTAIYDPKEKYDYYFLNKLEGFNPNLGSITIFGEKVNKGKLIGLSLQKIENIIKREIFDYILIEADGAKRKPIKAPADYEPVIPRSTTMIIGVVGLDCYGRKIEEIVHRPELFTDITETNIFEKIDDNIIVRLVLNENGLFKNSFASNILLLNKACTKTDILNGYKIKKNLLENDFKDKIIITNIKKKEFFR